MLVTYFIPPHPSLKAFVDIYILSTSGNNTVTFGGHWPATNESSLIFYLGDLPVHHHVDSPESVLSDKSNCLVGLLTRSNGAVHFSGRLHTFIIQFKANGITKIFRLAMNELTDRIFTTEDVFGNSIADLRDQLREVVDMEQMACLADRFLVNFLNRQKKTDTLYDGITAVSAELYNTTNFATIEQYAYKANMSVRNFERKFVEQVGISTKLYTKLVRFNEVMKIKVMEPEKNWTSIAHECGYFDQMHLIKDFKQFTDVTPTDYFRKSDLIKPYIDTSQPDNVDSKLRERFVFLKRASF